MKRLAGRVFALALLVVVPSFANAQKEPPDTKETKEAAKSLGLAMMQSSPEKKKPHYEQALSLLRAGMVKDAGNAKVWMMAGQVYVGLGDFLGADSSFKKAEALHPPYAEDIASERESAWVEAFNVGIGKMDAKDNDGAIQALELAESLYPHRPESKMNLGSLYASKNEMEKAIQVFEKAIASTNGPLKDKLKPEDAANWKRFADMAKSNIAQLIGAKGVEEFNAESFDAAIVTFTRASSVNPYSRDYLFNQAQSIYAKATKIEEKRDELLRERDALLAEEATLKKTKGQEAAAKAKADAAKVKTDEAAAFNPQLLPLYADITVVAEKTQKMDPQNEALYALIARSHKLTGDMAPDAAKKSEWQNKALAVFTAREALEFEVTDVAVQTGEGEAIIRGNVKNRKSAPNSPIKLKFTLLSIDGTQIGQQEITITAPAVDQVQAFEGKVPVTADVAGWRYEAVK